MSMVLDIRKIEASARLHRQRRMAKRRLLVWRAMQYGTAILIGATLALAIRDAPAKIAATVLDAQQTEGW